MFGNCCKSISHVLSWIYRDKMFGNTYGVKLHGPLIIFNSIRLSQFDRSIDWTLHNSIHLLTGGCRPCALEGAALCARPSWGTPQEVRHRSSTQDVSRVYSDVDTAANGGLLHNTSARQISGEQIRHPHAGHSNSKSDRSSLAKQVLPTQSHEKSWHSYPAGGGVVVLSWVKCSAQGSSIV